MIIPFMEYNDKTDHDQSHTDATFQCKFYNRFYFFGPNGQKLKRYDTKTINTPKCKGPN